MAWKAPRHSKLSASNGIHERLEPSKPQKLPTMKRGGSLRVGRVVSAVRSTSTWDNQSSSSFVQEEERRVQEELVEMLTVKLANKEKEVEMLRCKQNVVDQQFAGHDRQLQQQQEENARVVSEMTATNQELQRQVQLLQIQCEQLQVDSEAQHTAALEQRRLREKDQAQARLDNKAHVQIVDELRRDRHQLVNDRFALENKLQRVLQDQQTQSSLVDQLNSRCAQLEDELQLSEEDCQQLKEALIQVEQKCKGVEEVSRKLEEEKFALEEKQRARMKTLKTASSRAADMEKKRSELAQLTEQLAAFKKENGELKARRGQMSSQTKHLQARIAALESANTVQEKKLEDAATELESARKYGRDYQFRIKQLQEEIVFLKNRKPAANSSAVATGNSTPPDVQTAAPETDPADDMPCWMKG
ncbi:hypothetical protein PI125_g1312 [Phytophthora idaei]|nr:hypothetical protein PI125_g1312 [Phytophthora idaei]KAG3170501.1 hypothetical protein PI126_g2325 [Phytophthora idaei]